jgi:hypothetical protein
MSKLKPSSIEVLTYFKEKADKGKKFTIVAKEYGKSLGLSVTTIVKLLEATGQAKEIKTLFYDSHNMKHLKKKTKEEPKTKKPDYIVAEDEVISIKDIKTAEIQDIVSDTPGTLIDTLKTAGAEITALTVKFPNNVSVSYDKGSMKFNDCNWWIEKDKAVAVQEVIGKAIEIFDHIYK